MTGSVPSDTHAAVSAQEKEKKAERLQKAATKRAYQYPSPTRTSQQHCRKDSKSLLPPLIVSGVPFIPGAATSDHFATVPRRHRRRPLRRTSSAPPKAAKMEKNRRLGSRPERSQSLFALHLPSSSSSSSVHSGDTLSSLVRDYGGSAKSEIGAPVVVRVDPAGHMKRAVSYTSLSMRSGTPFRSANSTRPLPAPPRTTTDLEFHRYPVASTPRLPNCGTPRTNHAHHAGLHFQNSYNRGGKVSTERKRGRGERREGEGEGLHVYCFFVQGDRYNDYQSLVVIGIYQRKEGQSASL